MKKTLFACLTLLTLASCSMFKQVRTDKEHIKVDNGDEMPGITATKAHPDACLIYYEKKDKHYHIKYDQRTTMFDSLSKVVVDLPQDVAKISRDSTHPSLVHAYINKGTIYIQFPIWVQQ